MLLDKSEAPTNTDTDGIHYYYTLKELYDWLDLINEKLEEAQEKFERFTNARAEIWTRHELTRDERSEAADFQDWMLSRVKGEVAFLIQSRVRVNLMIAEVEEKEKNIM